MAKISEYPEATSLTGLYTIGTDDQTQTVKVSLEFVQTAANEATTQAGNASSAATSATSAASSATNAAAAANSAATLASTAATNADTAALGANTAKTNAETATTNANNATAAANSATSNASAAATTANTAAANADNARTAIETDLNGKLNNENSNEYATQKINGALQFMGVDASPPADSVNMLDKNGDSFLNVSSGVAIFGQADGAVILVTSAIEDVVHMKGGEPHSMWDKSNLTQEKVDAIQLIPNSIATPASATLNANTYTLFNSERTSGITVTLSNSAPNGSVIVFETTGATPLVLTSTIPIKKQSGFADIQPVTGDTCVYTAVMSGSKYIVNALIYN